MKRMSTLVLFLRTSDRKLAFYAAIALKAIEFIIMLLLLLSMRSVTTMRSKLAEPWSDSTLSTASPLEPWSARQQTMLSSSDHMVLRSTGFGSIWPEKQRLASLPASRTPDGSSACVRASFSVARSRSVRAESKRQSKPDPALRGDGDRDFDPQRAQGVRAGLSMRSLPSSRSPASAGLRHPNKFILA